MDAFERRLGSVIQGAVPPSRPFDAMVIAREAAAAGSRAKGRSSVGWVLRVRPAHIVVVAAVAALVVAFGLVGRSPDGSTDPSAVGGPGTSRPPWAWVTVTRPPVAVRGVMVGASTCDGPGGASDGVLHETLVCSWDGRWDDARLDGLWILSARTDNYLDATDLVLTTYSIEVHNDAGRWVLAPLLRLDLGGSGEPSPDSWVLQGEGDYAGLSAVLLTDATPMLHSIGFGDSHQPVRADGPRWSPVPVGQMPTVTSFGYIIDRRDAWSAEVARSPAPGR